MNRSEPPRWLEAVVAALLPASCREEVLGDLRERYRNIASYALDAASVVPMLIWSRMRRSFMQNNRNTVVYILAAFLIGLLTGVVWTGDPESTPRFIHKSIPFLLILTVWIVLMIRLKANRPRL
jgi:hypothetical protein